MTLGGVFSHLRYRRIRWACRLGAGQGGAQSGQARRGFERAWDFDWETSIIVDRTRRSDGERRQAAIGWLGNRLYAVDQLASRQPHRSEDL
jgi:hypothetical protein